MGARGFATRKKRHYKRAGRATEAEQAFVQQYVADQPTEITPTQERALARTMRRSREAVKAMIQEAKENLGEAVQHYVDVHRQAVDSALANGDAKSLEVAVRGSQWAMENIAIDGVRVIDQATKTPGGTKIMIGVKVGGANLEVLDKRVDVINGEEVEPSEEVKV